MFFFRKKSFVDSQLFRGITDCHSHILPGVDDGVQTIEESLSILSWYEELGVERVILTPHIMTDFARNNPQTLRTEFVKLREAYKGSIDLRLAGEYMLDSRFESLLRQGDMLTIIDNFMLVECSYFEAPIALCDTLEMIMKSGYFVVLAHVERYLFLDTKDYQRLHEMGVLFQLNALSLVGGYGVEVTRRAELLLSLSLYSFVGSDIHSLSRHQKYMSLPKLSQKCIRGIEAIKELKICF